MEQYDALPYSENLHHKLYDMGILSLYSTKSIRANVSFLSSTYLQQGLQKYKYAMLYHVRYKQRCIICDSDDNDAALLQHLRTVYHLMIWVIVTAW